MMDYDSIITPATMGKRRRLRRIFGRAGKCLLVPLDDNLISLDGPGTRPAKEDIADIEKTGPSAVMSFWGTATLVQDDGIPIILNMTASTDESDYTRKVIVSKIEEAVAMDAAAALVHINVSSGYVSPMLQNVGYMAGRCQSYGMPFIVTAYPRKEEPQGSYSYLDIRETDEKQFAKLVSHCVRIAFELGADAIKTQYTGSAESLAKVVLAACGKPVIIATGGVCEAAQLYRIAEQAVAAGAAGIAIGRNVFALENAAKIIANIKKILFPWPD